MSEGFKKGTLFFIKPEKQKDWHYQVFLLTEDCIYEDCIYSQQIHKHQPMAFVILGPLEEPESTGELCVSFGRSREAMEDLFNSIEVKE